MRTEEKSMLVLEYAPSYGIEILRARRFTEEEKAGYLPWFAEIGFTGVGECEKLPNITWKDLPSRKTDGCFRGCDNHAWIISEEEAASFHKLNADRQNELDRKKAQQAEEEKAAADLAEREYNACKSQFDSWAVGDIKRKDGDLICENTFAIHGKTLRFVERSLFDCGNCINLISDDPEKHYAYLTCENGVRVWRGKERTFPLDEDEIACVLAMCKYGTISRMPIRM